MLLLTFAIDVFGRHDNHFSRVIFGMFLLYSQFSNRLISWSFMQFLFLSQVLMTKISSQVHRLNCLVQSDLCWISYVTLLDFYLTSLDNILYSYAIFDQRKKNHIYIHYICVKWNARLLHHRKDCCFDFDFFLLYPRILNLCTIIYLS